MVRLKDIDTPIIVSFSLSLILVIVGLVLIGIIGKKRFAPYLAVAGLIAALVLGHLYLHGWLLGWLASYNFLTALIIGVVVGVVTLRVAVSSGIVALIAASIPMAMMYSTGWEPSYGWGWFLVPLPVAGVLLVHTLARGPRSYTIYILCWLAVVWTVFLPFALMEWDWASLSIKGFIFSYPVEVTIVYAISSLILLVFPLIMSYLKVGHNSVNRIR